MTKIEIDLEKILGNKEDLIHDIVDVLTQESRFLRDIEEKTTKVANEMIKKEMENNLKFLINQTVDEEYIRTDKWGDKDKSTTIRKEIARACQEIATFKQCSYRGDNNEFTKIIIETAEKEIEKFKKDYISKVNELFTQEVFDYAIKTLQEKLSLIKTDNKGK